MDEKSLNEKKVLHFLERDNLLMWQKYLLAYVDVNFNA